MTPPSAPTTFLCDACGADFAKWFGKCPSCGEWGTVKEFSAGRKGSRMVAERRPSALLSSLSRNLPRFSTGLPEVDRTLGGGLLPGSLVLLGGDPGIGKSTLALQMAGRFPTTVLYVSGEESEEQVALRAGRMSIASDHLSLTGENRLEGVWEQVSLLKPGFLVIDSIQTVYSERADALPGSVSQIRECGQAVLEKCKREGVTALVIGHVTKEGVLAGPKMLEHMVDTVLYLEGDLRDETRVLRAVKNRFGPTNEIAVLEMTGSGLKEVANPSSLFLGQRTASVSGSAVFPSMEGSRPFLVEIQGLVSNASYGTPQRNVTGIELRRLAMILAVLEKRVGLPLGTKDVFVNCAGGIRIEEPAADLAVAVAVTSSFKDRPVDAKSVFLGEVSLAGELRPVSRLEARLQEAGKLGFVRAIVPAAGMAKASRGLSSSITPQGAATISEALELSSR